MTVLLVFVDDQLKAWFSTAMSYTSVLYLLRLILKGYNSLLFVKTSPCMLDYKCRYTMVRFCSSESVLTKARTQVNKAKAH